MFACVQLSRMRHNKTCNAAMHCMAWPLGLWAGKESCRRWIQCQDTQKHHSLAPKRRTQSLGCFTMPGSDLKHLQRFTGSNRGRNIVLHFIASYIWYLIPADTCWYLIPYLSTVANHNGWSWRMSPFPIPFASRTTSSSAKPTIKSLTS